MYEKSRINLVPPSSSSVSHGCAGFTRLANWSLFVLRSGADMTEGHLGVNMGRKKLLFLNSRFSD